MVDGLNPQAGNLLREASGANARTAQDAQNAQNSTNPAAQEQNEGAARPVQDVTVDISAQGQQAAGEQVTNQAVSEPSAADTNPAASSSAGTATVGGNDDATESGGTGPTQAGNNPEPQDADEALGTQIDTTA